MATKAIVPSSTSANGCLKKPYIGRRTGKVIDIVARINSDGYENIDDYFPDSESSDTEDNSEITQTVVTRSNKNNSSKVSKSKQLASDNSTSKNVDATSNGDPNESTAENSLEDKCSSDSAFDSPEENLPASGKVYNSANKGSASHSCLPKATEEHGAMDGNEVPAGSNNSLETNTEFGMTVGQSSLEEDDEHGMHTTRKRLHFSPSSEPDTQTEKNSSPAKQAINEDKNVEVTDDDDDDLIIVERAKTTPNTSLAKKNIKNKKTIKQKITKNNPKNETELIIEDICKSEDTFLTLKKKANPNESKLVDNNDLESSIALSIKPLASRKNTRSKIPVSKSKAKGVYPKRSARTRVIETAETIQGDIKQVEVLVETKTNEMHFGPIFENEFVDETEEDEIPDQMSVEFETDASVAQNTSSLQRSSHVKATTEKQPRKRGKQMASSEPKSKRVVNRKTQRKNTRGKTQTVAVVHVDEEDEQVPEIPIETNQEVETHGSDDNEVGDQMSAESEDPGGEQESVSGVSLQQSSQVGRSSAVKGHATRMNTRQKKSRKNSTSSSEESIGDAGPIKSTSINMKKDSKVNSEVMDEDADTSVEDGVDQSLKPSKYQDETEEAEIPDQMSVESETDASVAQNTSSLQRSLHVKASTEKQPRKRGKQMASSEPKSKRVVNRKTQRKKKVKVSYPKRNTRGKTQTVAVVHGDEEDEQVPEIPIETNQEVETDGSDDNEVGDQMSAESEDPGGEQETVSGVSLQQSSQVGRLSAVKGHATRMNTRQKESRKNSTSSSEESIGDAGPIKSTSINMKKDSKVNSEVMEEDADTSVEDGVDQSLKPSKYQGNKIELESVLACASGDILNTSTQYDGGLRRSHRNRVPTLQYWKNERIEYDRRKSGWIVKDVIVNPTPEVNPRKRKNTTKSVTRRAKKGAKASNLKEESELSDFYIPEGFEEHTNPVGIVINSDTLKEVKMNLIHSNQMLDFQPPVRNEDDDENSSATLLVDKYFSHAIFGAGQVILRPGAEKGRQNVRGDTMVFYICSGSVLVTIHEDSFMLPRGSSFFIPQGNVYNLKNLDNKKDARLFFTQVKG